MTGLDLWYDPRSLETGEARASLHAKCVVVDRSEALVTSANFTEAAQRRNIELGVSIRHRPTVERLGNYFAGLRQAGQLARCRCPIGVLFHAHGTRKYMGVPDILEMAITASGAAITIMRFTNSLKEMVGMRTSPKTPFCKSGTF